jgi:hypothetical protein
VRSEPQRWLKLQGRLGADSPGEPEQLSPAVLIVALAAAFVVALVALLRARPEDIEKLVRLMTGWFSK